MLYNQVPEFISIVHDFSFKAFLLPTECWTRHLKKTKFNTGSVNIHYPYTESEKASIITNLSKTEEEKTEVSFPGWKKWKFTFTFHSLKKTCKLNNTIKKHWFWIISIHNCGIYIYLFLPASCVFHTMNFLTGIATQSK